MVIWKDIGALCPDSQRLSRGYLYTTSGLYVQSLSSWIVQLSVCQGTSTTYIGSTWL